MRLGIMEIYDIYGASNMTTKSHELLETETLLEKLIDTVSNVDRLVLQCSIVLNVRELFNSAVSDRFREAQSNFDEGADK
jgi:hypothetical protein